MRRIVAGLVLAAVTATAAIAQPYKAPRTEFGDPDLQGVWTNASITSLERPQGIATLVMTPQQATAAEAMQRARLERAAGDTDPASGAPPVAENPGGYNTFWIDRGSKFAVVNGEIRSSWIVEPADGHIPYTQGARAQLRAMFQRRGRQDGPESLSLGERCIVGYGSTGGPPMLNVLYNNNYQIVQSPGFVTIVVEMNHDARVIRLGGPHAPAAVTPWMGDSVGRWEGETLVVETTNLNPNQQFAGRLYLPPDATVTERFTRVAKGELLYEFSVASPTAYTQPWRAQMPMVATEGPIYEYACHEGNYSLPGILAGARAQEQAPPAAP